MRRTRIRIRRTRIKKIVNERIVGKCGREEREENNPTRKR